MRSLNPGVADVVVPYEIFKFLKNENCTCNMIESCAYVTSSYELPGIDAKTGVDLTCPTHKIFQFAPVSGIFSCAKVVLKK